MWRLARLLLCAAVLTGAAADDAAVLLAIEPSPVDPSWVGVPCPREPTAGESVYASSWSRVYCGAGMRVVTLDLRNSSSSASATEFSVTWYDAIDAQHVVKLPQKVTGGEVVTLQPPSLTSHWIGLLLR